jgi:hypothetical protein
VAAEAAEKLRAAEELAKVRCAGAVRELPLSC